MSTTFHNQLSFISNNTKPCQQHDILLHLNSKDDNIFHVPGRRIRSVYGRIRLKYGKFRPGNGDRIRCTVIRFSYGIIRCRIRHSFTVLRIRTVFAHRIRTVFVPCHESVISAAVYVPYLRHINKMPKIHNQLP